MAAAANKSASAVVVAPVAPNPDINPIYRCCCGRIHVKNCAIIIGVLEIVCACSLNSVSGWLAVFMIVLSLVTVCLMLYGIKVTNHMLVIPYLIWQAMELVILIVLTILCIVSLFDTTPEDDIMEPPVDGRTADPINAEQGVERVAVIRVLPYLVLFGVLFVFHVCFFLVVRRLFEYLQAKRAQMFPGVGVVVPGPGAEPPASAPPVGVSPKGSVGGGGPAAATTSASSDRGNEA